jgi:hypothetical protein
MYTHNVSLPGSWGICGGYGSGINVDEGGLPLGGCPLATSAHRLILPLGLAPFSSTTLIWQATVQKSFQTDNIASCWLLSIQFHHWDLAKCSQCSSTIL